MTTDFRDSLDVETPHSFHDEEDVERVYISSPEFTNEDEQMYRYVSSRVEGGEHSDDELQDSLNNHPPTNRTYVAPPAMRPEDVNGDLVDFYASTNREETAWRDPPSFHSESREVTQVFLTLSSSGRADTTESAATETETDERTAAMSRTVTADSRASNVNNNSNGAPPLPPRPGTDKSKNVQQDEPPQVYAQSVLQRPPPVQQALLQQGFPAQQVPPQPGYMMDPYNLQQLLLQAQLAGAMQAGGGAPMMLPPQLLAGLQLQPGFAQGNINQMPLQPANVHRGLAVNQSPQQLATPFGGETVGPGYSDGPGYTDTDTAVESYSDENTTNTFQSNINLESQQMNNVQPSRITHRPFGGEAPTNRAHRAPASRRAREEQPKKRTGKIALMPPVPPRPEVDFVNKNKVKLGRDQKAGYGQLHQKRKEDEHITKILTAPPKRLSEQQQRMYREKQEFAIRDQDQPQHRNITRYASDTSLNDWHETPRQNWQETPRQQWEESPRQQYQESPRQYYGETPRQHNYTIVPTEAPAASRVTVSNWQQNNSVRGLQPPKLWPQHRGEEAVELQPDEMDDYRDKFGSMPSVYEQVLYEEPGSARRNDLETRQTFTSYKPLPPIRERAQLARGGRSDSRPGRGRGAAVSHTAAPSKGAPSDGYAQSFVKARTQPRIQYKQYNIRDYRKLKKEMSVKVGGLGPDLDSGDRKESRENYMRRQNYAKYVGSVNKQQIVVRQRAPSQEPPPEHQRHRAAMEFAKSVPKPRTRRPVPEEPQEPHQRRLKRPPNFHHQPTNAYASDGDFESANENGGGGGHVIARQGNVVVERERSGGSRLSSDSHEVIDLDALSRRHDEERAYAESLRTRTREAV